MQILDKFCSRRNQSPPDSKRRRSGDCTFRRNDVQVNEDDGYLIDEKSPSPTAMIYKSELDYLSRCVLDYPNIETGGQLFGFWTNQGVPVVMYVIGPGRNANHQPTFFNQDGRYLTEVGNALLDRYGLCHIGEWHSHHQLGLARPSGHDAQTMHNGLRNIPQRRLLLCICNYENGKSTVNPYNFHENDMRGYSDALWQVIDMDSPFRKIADTQLADILIHPHTVHPRHGLNRLLQCDPKPQTSSGPAIKIPSTYWVSRPGNLEVLKDMVKRTKSAFGGLQVDTQVNETGILQLHIPARGLDIRLGEKFPEDSPVLLLRGSQINVDNLWIKPAADSEIGDSYDKWLNGLFAHAGYNEF